MSRRAITNLIKYGCCAGFVIAFVCCYILAKDIGSVELLEKYRILCDGFCVPGILLLAVGAMIWAEGEGAFYGISYAAKIAFRSLIPGGRLEKEERYGDYVARKRENKVTGYGFLFVSGLVSVAVSLVFYALYYAVN